MKVAERVDELGSRLSDELLTYIREMGSCGLGDGGEIGPVHAGACPSQSSK
jgi:hypothetical protein